MGFLRLRGRTRTRSPAGDFVESTWEGHRLFLAAVAGTPLPAPPPSPLANVRVMVPHVGDYWRRANHIGVPVVVPIADRDYGLRDFTIADPDVFGVRLASRLS